MSFDWSPRSMQDFRDRKPAIDAPINKQRKCPQCGKPELRGCFRNGRCRACRKAQP